MSGSDISLRFCRFRMRHIPTRLLRVHPLNCTLSADNNSPFRSHPSSWPHFQSFPLFVLQNTEPNVHFTIGNWLLVKLLYYVRVRAFSLLCTTAQPNDAIFIHARVPSRLRSRNHYRSLNHTPACRDARESNVMIPIRIGIARNPLHVHFALPTVQDFFVHSVGRLYRQDQNRPR